MGFFTRLRGSSSTPASVNTSPTSQSRADQPTPAATATATAHPPRHSHSHSQPQPHSSLQLQDKPHLRTLTTSASAQHLNVARPASPFASSSAASVNSKRSRKSVLPWKREKRTEVPSIPYTSLMSSAPSSPSAATARQRTPAMPLAPPRTYASSATPLSPVLQLTSISPPLTPHTPQSPRSPTSPVPIPSQGSPVRSRRLSTDQHLTYEAKSQASSTSEVWRQEGGILGKLEFEGDDWELAAGASASAITGPSGRVGGSSNVTATIGTLGDPIALDEPTKPTASSLASGSAPTLATRAPKLASPSPTSIMIPPITSALSKSKASDEIEEIRTEADEESKRFWKGKMRNRRSSTAFSDGHGHVERPASPHKPSQPQTPDRPPQLRRPSSSLFHNPFGRTNMSRASLALDLDSHPVDDGSFQLKSFRHISGTSDVEGAGGLEQYLTHVKRESTVMIDAPVSPVSVASAPASAMPTASQSRPRPSSVATSITSADDFASSRVSVALFRKGIRRPSSSIMLDDDDDVPLSLSRANLRETSVVSLNDKTAPSVTAAGGSPSVVPKHVGSPNTALNAPKISPSLGGPKRIGSPSPSLSYTVHHRNTPSAGSASSGFFVRGAATTRDDRSVVKDEVTASPVSIRRALSTPPPQMAPTVLPANAADARPTTPRTLSSGNLVHSMPQTTLPPQPAPPPPAPIGLPEAQAQAEIEMLNLPLPPDQMPDSPLPPSQPSQPTQTAQARKLSSSFMPTSPLSSPMAILDEPLRRISGFWGGPQSQTADGLDPVIVAASIGLAERTQTSEIRPSLQERLTSAATAAANAAAAMAASAASSASAVTGSSSEPRLYIPPVQGSPESGTETEKRQASTDSGSDHTASPLDSAVAPRAPLRSPLRPPPPPLVSTSMVPAPPMRPPAVPHSSFARAVPKKSAGKSRADKDGWATSSDEEDVKQTVRGPKTQASKAKDSSEDEPLVVIRAKASRSSLAKNGSSVSTVTPSVSRLSLQSSSPPVPRSSDDIVRPVSRTRGILRPSSALSGKARSPGAPLVPHLPSPRNSIPALAAVAAATDTAHRHSPSPASSQSGLSGLTGDSSTQQPITPRSSVDPPQAVQATQAAPKSQHGQAARRSWAPDSRVKSQLLNDVPQVQPQPQSQPQLPPHPQPQSQPQPQLQPQPPATEQLRPPSEWSYPYAPPMGYDMALAAQAATMKQQWMAQYMAGASRYFDDYWERASSASTQGPPASVGPGTGADPGSSFMYPSYGYSYQSAPPAVPYVYPVPQQYPTAPQYPVAPQFPVAQYQYAGGSQYGGQTYPTQAPYPPYPQGYPQAPPAGYPFAPQSMYSYAPPAQSVFGGEFGPPVQPPIPYRSSPDAYPASGSVDPNSTQQQQQRNRRSSALSSYDFPLPPAGGPGGGGSGHNSAPSTPPRPYSNHRRQSSGLVGDINPPTSWRRGAGAGPSGPGTPGEYEGESGHTPRPRKPSNSYAT